jgi:uncharacterized protein (DUF433 family)
MGTFERKPVGFSTSNFTSQLQRMDVMQQIEVNPKIMMGKPVIKGTRVTVEIILEKLSHGMTFSDILQAYPFLTEEKIKAALAFAAESLKGDMIYPVAV